MEHLVENNSNNNNNNNERPTADNVSQRYDDDEVLVGCLLFVRERCQQFDMPTTMSSHQSIAGKE